MKTFGVEYHHDGGTWSFNVHATNHADAERRLRSIRANAEIIGELVVSIHVPVPGASLLVRLRRRISNLFT